MVKYPNRIAFFFIILISIALSGCSVPFVKSKYAGLQVDAVPESTIYLDGKHVGSTKYLEEKLKPNEYIVKLVPLIDSLSPWETKVKLQPGKTTIIQHEFGNSLPESSSYILQLEKIANKKAAELTIVTTPENVIVRIDDQPKGFSPLTNIDISPNTHKVTLSVPGYKTIYVNVNAIAGYRVLLTAELGKALALQPSATSSAEIISQESSTPSATPAPSSSPSPTPKPSPTASLPKPYVEISETPTGWLRVRSEPNGLLDNEVAKVNTNETFPYIESNDTGWYKIEYEPGNQGWVAATFAKLIK